MVLFRAMTHARGLGHPPLVDVDGSQIWEFSRLLDQARQELAAELGMGLTDLLGLHVIHTEPGCTPGELARSLHLTVSGTSAVIDRLVSRHLVRRVPHPVDRRSLRLEVTALGRHGASWSTDKILEQFDQMLQGATGTVTPTVGAGRLQLTCGSGWTPSGPLSPRDAHADAPGADGETTPPSPPPVDGQPDPEPAASQTGPRPTRSGS